jgi:hypothetical protein
MRKDWFIWALCVLLFGAGAVWGICWVPGMSLYLSEHIKLADVLSSGAIGLTAIAVWAVSWATIQSHQKTIESQEKVAATNFLKGSRQVWINDLRDTCSRYIASVLAIQRISQKTREERAYLAAQSPGESQRIVAARADDILAAKKEAESLKLKIELLLNPDESDSKGLMKSINAALGLSHEPGDATAKQCELIVWNCQIILKQEWEKVKAGK